MKAARRLAFAVLGLVLLSLFSWAVKDATSGGHRLGLVSNGLRKLAGFPDDVVEVFNSSHVKGIPDSYIKLDAGFKPVNELSYDLFGLNSFWSAKDDRWEVRLFNFRNDSVLYTWNVQRTSDWVLDKTDRQFENAPLVHSLIGPDRTLITKLEKTPNLICLDRNSKVLWVNHELLFHHAIQPDPDSVSFWVCASPIPMFPDQPSVGRVVKNVNGHTLPFQDDLIVRVDMRTGKILYKKGVAEMLSENHMDGLLYGGGLEDPIHLNDIMPVRIASSYWQPGDLFLSIKRRSSILLYRPSQNRLVDVINGPYISQHDVNVISDHEISVFNNRYITSYQYPENVEARIPKGTPRDTIKDARAEVFDFVDRSFHELHTPEFLQEDIRSTTQGILDILPNGDVFVEAQGIGKYYVFSDHGIVMRKVFPAPENGYVHGPNWTRIYTVRP